MRVSDPARNSDGYLRARAREFVQLTLARDSIIRTDIRRGLRRADYDERYLLSILICARKKKHDDDDELRISYHGRGPAIGLGLLDAG